ncbi:MAG TPA: hypothetical protein VGC84_19155 [Ilumatobacteraceae bacterium]|jgi:hypothetical protein
MPDDSEQPTLPPDDEVAPDDLELDIYDLDRDGEIGVIDHERARLGLIDARLEEIAQEGGVKGSLAEVAHKVIDKIDNDTPPEDDED